MSSLNCRLLGTFQLAIDNEPIVIPQARQRDLITLLLLRRNAPQNRQQIAFQFWPDTSEKQARTNLRQLLYHLRQSLPQLHQFIQDHAGELRWCVDITCDLDVAEFELSINSALKTDPNRAYAAAQRLELTTAIELYRGDLVPDCYEEWILPERERFYRLFIDGLDRLVKYQEAERDYPLAIRYVNQWLQREPLDETVYRRLMRLHCLDGDPVGAHRTYEICAETLNRELGLEPSKETQHLRARIQHLLVASGERTANPKLVEATMIGRHVEWQQLQATWHQIMNGNPKMFVISGEAGIGKTRLAQELISWVKRQGIDVSYSRSFAAEGDLAYGPIVDWLRSDSLKARWNRLEDVWLSEISRLLPEIRKSHSDVPKPDALTEPWQRQHLFEALARAITQSEEPLLLVLDDLQWCDADTLQFLHFLLRFDSHNKLLIVGTVRLEEVEHQHPLTDLLLALGVSGQLAEIELGPLGFEETGALIAQTADGELCMEEQQRIVIETEGHPLFVVETVRNRSNLAKQAGEPPPDKSVMTEQLIPPAMYAVIQSRLNQLSPVARELASVAAVIGRHFTFDILQQVSEYALIDLARGLDELQKRRIVRSQGQEEYDFSHDRLREVAYSELGHLMRRLLHGKVAAALQMRISSGIDIPHAQLGFHFEQSGELESAIHHYRQAAEDAINLLALEVSLHHLLKILALFEKLPETPEHDRQAIDIWILLSQVLITTSGHTSIELAEALGRANFLARKLNDTARLFDTQVEQHIYYMNVTDWYKADSIAQELLLLAENLDDPESLATAYVHWATTKMHRGEIADSVKFYHGAVQTYPDDSRKKLHLVAWIVDSLWLAGYPHQSIATANNILLQVKDEKNPLQRAFTHDVITYMYQWLHLVESVYHLSSENISLCDKYGLPDYRGSATVLQGWALVMRGAKVRGISQIERAIESLNDINNAYHIPYFLSLLAEAYARNGQLDLALQIVARAINESERTGDIVWLAELHRLRGEYMYNQNRNVTQAEECFQQAISVARKQQAKSLELRATTSLARLWQQHGNKNEAYDILAEIYAWFSEGFDTADLIEAQKLLNECG